LGCFLNISSTPMGFEVLHRKEEHNELYCSPGRMTR